MFGAVKIRAHILHLERKLWIYYYACRT